MTQGERIIGFCKMYGSITPIQAWRRLGISKLATRVSELTKDGVEFDREYITVKNRYGEKVRVMQYSLKE